MATPTGLTTFEQSISTAISDIVTDQASYKGTHGKYEQITPEDSTTEGLCVTEYVGPSGPGYVIELERTIEGQVWRKWIDYGPEERTQEWFKVKDNG